MAAPRGSAWRSRRRRGGARLVFSAREARAGAAAAARPRTSRRRRNPPTRAAPPAPRSRAAPEAALPRLVLAQAGLQRGAVEIRPELVAEDELGVGALPEQVVGEALLAAGADQEIGVVHLRCVEQAGKIVIRAALEPLRRVEDLRPPAVVEGDEKRDPLVPGRLGFRPLHPLDQRPVEALAAA